jgi:hypothetical protein
VSNIDQPIDGIIVWAIAPARIILSASEQRDRTVDHPEVVVVIAVGIGAPFSPG